MRFGVAHHVNGLNDVDLSRIRPLRLHTQGPEGWPNLHLLLLEILFERTMGTTPNSHRVYVGHLSKSKCHWLGKLVASTSPAPILGSKIEI